VYVSLTPKVGLLLASKEFAGELKSVAQAAAAFTTHWIDSVGERTTLDPTRVRIRFFGTRPTEFGPITEVPGDLIGTVQEQGGQLRVEQVRLER
jgi:hypothetical protein